ncbi:hypothetical protein [Peribacillus simplex]|uniref:hypothetical protein n=1 Tax=Peribacillus simplex TaxID=1478 RepID=UPI003D27423F
MFGNINDLHSDVQPIIWTAFKTGLRILDTLSLTQDCLVKLKGKYSLVTDIEKTYVKGHSIPIDDELAHMLVVLKEQSKLKSSQDNNPNGYIFVRYRVLEKENPITNTRLLNN